MSWMDVHCDRCGQTVSDVWDDEAKAIAGAHRRKHRREGAEATVRVKLAYRGIGGARKYAPWEEEGEP